MYTAGIAPEQIADILKIDKELVTKSIEEAQKVTQQITIDHIMKMHAADIKPEQIADILEIEKELVAKILKEHGKKTTKRKKKE